MTPGKAAALAFVATALVICGTLACVGILTDDDSKVPTRPVSTPTWSPTVTPDGGSRPTADSDKKVIVGNCDEYDLGCGTPNAGCATSRLGKFFVVKGKTYMCSGPRPYRWRAAR